MGPCKICERMDPEGNRRRGPVHGSPVGQRVSSGEAAPTGLSSARRRRSANYSHARKVGTGTRMNAKQLVTGDRLRGAMLGTGLPLPTDLRTELALAPPNTRCRRRRPDTPPGSVHVSTQCGIPRSPSSRRRCPDHRDPEFTRPPACLSGPTVYARTRRSRISGQSGAAGPPIMAAGQPAGAPTTSSYQRHELSVRQCSLS